MPPTPTDASAHNQPSPLALQPRQWTALIMGTIGVAMFAGTLPATRLALEGFDPVFITFARAFFAGVAATTLLVLTGRARPTKADVPQFAAIALCLVVGFPLFTGLAMEHVPASHGGVVLAILPLGTAIAAAVVGGERPGKAFWAVSALGGLVVLVFSLSDSGWAVRWGDVFLVAAAASAALGYALSGRLTRRMPGWVVISWALVLSLPFSAIGSLATLPEVWPTAGHVWAGLAYLSLVSMLLGFFFWNTALALGGVAKIGQLQLLQPFFTLAIAALVAGEVFQIRQAAFAVAVVVIVATAQRLRVAGAPPLQR
ncbi:MAG: DMT family transporter [Pseudomonadota bacterium]